MKREKIAKSAALLALLALASLAYYENAVKTGPACKGFALCFEGAVDRIIDGDTVVIENKTVRLALVNAPEKSEETGKRAESFTAEACPAGSHALVDEDDGQKSGSYGRLVAVVYCNGKSLNELLLDSGFGEIYASYCKTSEFRNEQWAKRYGC
ncbi:MAG: thermonuclease family protein [Candidatus Aenigmarchaeota archaeon]|nr:thermonuclease family protein [Candidatus Aenigmarchaeota archaeon]